MKKLTSQRARPPRNSKLSVIGNLPFCIAATTDQPRKPSVETVGKSSDEGLDRKHEEPGAPSRMILIVDDDEVSLVLWNQRMDSLDLANMRVCVDGHGQKAVAVA
ncbi:hypothetical protein [Asticcacaulis benevestitus]|uniref:hypothetical protein n=2 Tax=Asticcacaulis benevestitus TaxID=347481 RepID=UPI0012F8E844|nr:hypothetical protein [Asticcacaulis benevestitus]